MFLPDDQKRSVRPLRTPSGGSRAAREALVQNDRAHSIPAWFKTPPRSGSMLRGIVIDWAATREMRESSLLNDGGVSGGAFFTAIDSRLRMPKPEFGRMRRSRSMGQPQWSVYLVRCGTGSLYTGIATDVARRLADHLEVHGKGAKYLRGKGPLSNYAADLNTEFGFVDYRGIAGLERFPSTTGFHLHDVYVPPCLQQETDAAQTSQRERALLAQLASPDHTQEQRVALEEE